MAVHLWKSMNLDTFWANFRKNCIYNIGFIDCLNIFAEKTNKYIRYAVYIEILMPNDAQWIISISWEKKSKITVIWSNNIVNFLKS